MKGKLSPYVPGIILFIAALTIGLMTYQDYGMGWDEPDQRGPGVLSYDYIFHGSQELFTKATDNHGAGFELLLVFLEKGMKLTDPRDIYMMRHIETHIFFLLGALAGYILIYRLFKNYFLACLGFIMLAFHPRLYAHSFINTKDIPFLAMITIVLAYCRLTFLKDKPAHFLVLGLLCGYATSIRIMGVMLAVFLLFFLFMDLMRDWKNKEHKKKIIIHAALYSVGFCFALVISWPYLWKSPVHNFLESFSALSHYQYDAEVLFNGGHAKTMNLPWTYFPTWFIITNPVLWLLIGCAGLVRLMMDIMKKPSSYLKNTVERNYLLFLLCFWAPIVAVIGLNSVIYDDWRHLYFVYPPFVLIAIYFLYKMMLRIPGKYHLVIQGACVIQIGMIGMFMVKNHPFGQVYFNELVSHEPEYLRENYELEYWGASFKQALDHIITKDTAKVIRVACNYDDPCYHNILMLHQADRKRIEVVPVSKIAQADYFITNYRGHPEDYPSKNIEFNISVLNSSIMTVFDLKKK